MNSRQKEVLQSRVKSEKDVLNRIKKVYEEAYKEIEGKINELSADELTQSKIYQKQYQQALKKQVSAILDNLNSKQYDTVSQYLKDCYEDAFIGALYDLQGQGVPLIFPINQEDVAKAIVHNTKLKKPLYESLGYDVDKLKKTIQQEISRGFASGADYTTMARNIRNQGGVSMRKAFTIARTEGHRIHQESAEDTIRKAKDAGADVVKQWDSTLDKRTRPTHRILDGQLREVDEYFEVNGHRAMRPGGFGIAAEDINCRCVILQRARWALESDRAFTKWDGEKGRLIRMKEKDLKNFKSRYKEIVGQITLEQIMRRFKSKKEAVDYFQEEQGIQFKDSRKYPIDEELVIQAAEWHNNFVENFPGFVKKNPVKIPVIVNKAPSGMKNAVGYYKYYTQRPDAIELALNAGYHSSKRGMKEYMERTYESKWMSSADPNHTFVHEFGHHVSHSMRWITKNPNWEHDFIKECIDEFKRDYPEYPYSTCVGMGDYVSRYGASSESELFAEAFAEYFGEGEPRLFAKIFGDKLTLLLKGV